MSSLSMPDGVTEELVDRDGLLVRILTLGPDAPPASCDRFAAVARILEIAAGTGLPRCIAWSPDTPACLELAHTTGRTLDRLVRIPVQRAVALAAAIAALIADLHERDIALGAPRAESISVDADDNPVFGHIWSLAQPCTADDRASDIRALAAIVEDLAGSSSEMRETVPIPLDRRTREAEGARAALLSIADRAALCESSDSVTARSVATQLHTLHAGNVSRASMRPRALRLGSMALAIGGVVLLGLALVRAGGAGSAVAPHDLKRPRPTIPVEAPAAEACAEGEAVGRRPSSDLDRDGCADSLLVEGPTIRTSSGRFVLGDHDDQVLVGDVRCDGTQVAVLLRRPEGALFVFERWAAPGEPIEAPAALVDPELTKLRSIPSATCPLVLAIRADGTARGVPIERSPTTAKDSP